MYGFRTIVSGFLGTGTNNSKDGEQERGRSDNVPVDLTKDDDEDESPPPKINPPAIPPPRPPQRTYNAPGGVRDQIYDPYPEPPASNQPTTGSSMSNSKRKPSDIEDERRLLGSFKAPKDAVMIQLPGSEAQTPAPMRKPGAGRGFQPKNTLHDSRYQGTARPPVHTGAQRAKAATRHPNGLTLETSRGRNGRSAQDDYDFPDSDRVVKKPKLAHPQTNGQISRSAQLCSSLNSEPCSEVDGKVVKIPASSVRNEQKPNVRPNQAPRSPQWEPSGNQESRRVEEILKRPQDRGKQMARHGNGTNATRDPQKPTRNQEFLEISDDDSTVKASHKASAVQDKRGPGRPPKRRKGDVEDVVEVESRKRNDPTQHLSSLTGVNGKNPKRKPSAAETIDVDSAGRPTDIGLAASVLHALGPGKSTIQRVQEEKARHSIDDSADELDGKDRPSASPRRRSPAKSAPGDVPASDAISGDEDELQRDIPASFHKGKSVAKNAPGPPSKMRTTAKQKSSSTWKVEEFVDNYGKVHGGFGFLNLSIYIGREIKAVRLSQPGVKSHENLHVIEGQRIRGILTSSDPECRILRIRGTGTPEPWNDIKFRNHEEMVDFIEGLQVLTTLKDICLDKTLKHMETIYGKERHQPRRSYNHPVDSGAEEALLNKRVGDGKVQSKPLAQATTEGGRPRQARKLISEMLTGEKSQNQAARSSNVAQDQKSTVARQSRPEVDAPSSSSTPVRSTRGRKLKSPTPDPSYSRYSKTTGLGPAWDQPIVYPEIGKKRVTVDFRDLERLDEGEFLNDNLIEFYTRWLQVTCKLKEKTAYFFGTHFYTTLSDTTTLPRGVKNRNINYQAVERWTAKDDLFSHDFVVMPINELAHWYLAIICNLPTVQRRLESQEDEGAEGASQDATAGAKGTASHPVTVSKSVEAQVEDRGTITNHPAEEQGSGEGSIGTTPTRGMTKQYDVMSLDSPRPAAARETSKAPESPATGAQNEAMQGADASQDQGAPCDTTKPTQSRDAQQDTSQVSEGVFGNAAPPSPDKKKKGKRKSGPGPRKYDTKQPAIVIIDPMGTGHPRAIATLKDYLVEEASQKRGMDIDKNMFQGINARKGIPQQDNYYDCGIFVCGYLDKFMRNPEEFGRKLLTQEFSLEEDWPEMRSGKMRDQMRVLLQGLAKEQREARVAKKAHKRTEEKKATAASSPSDASIVIDLSPPVKQREIEQKPMQDAEEAEEAPSRTSRSHFKPNPVYTVPSTIGHDDGDEMLLQPQGGLQSQLEAAADGQEGEQSQESHISDSESDVEREVGGVKPGFEIYQDPDPSVGDAIAAMEIENHTEGGDEFAGFSP